MLTAILISLIVVLAIGFGITCFYLVRFARIIMSIEDSLSEGLGAFERTEESLTNLLKMQMFFESKEIQVATKSALDDVTLCKMAVAQVVKDFTRLSKQKYEMVRVDGEYELEETAEPSPREQRMGG